MDFIKARKNKAISLVTTLMLLTASMPVMAETNINTIPDPVPPIEQEYNVDEVKPIIEKVQVFNDVPETHWAFDTITRLQGAGVIEESLNGDFNPDKLVSRKEFTLYLMKTLGIKSSKIVGSYLEKAYDVNGNPYPKPKLNKFVDVWKFDDCEDYIAAAYENGIINGVSDNNFDPEGLITREQAAVIMTNTLKVYYEGTIYSGEKEFFDSNQISSWAKESVNTAVTMGIFNGYEDGAFKPKGSITKSETMTIIKKVVEQVKGTRFGKPQSDYFYQTVDERLTAVGAKYSDWYYGLCFDRDYQEFNIDETTLRESHFEGPEFKYGLYALIAIPLVGDEEWSNWVTYLAQGEKESPLHVYDNGTIQELVDEGLIKAEFREGDFFGSPSIEVRIKDNIQTITMWRHFTYEKRDILNLEEVLKNDPSLLDDISYIQPIKNYYDGEYMQIEKIPAPYTLKKTND